MGRVNETIHNVNTTLRTLLMLVLTGGAALVGYKGYEIYNEPQKQLADREAELEKTRGSLQTGERRFGGTPTGSCATKRRQVAEKTAQIERLEVSRKLLQVTHRLAHLTVLDQRELPPSDAAQSTADADAESPTNLISRIEFVEVNDEGNPIGEAKQFEIIGDMVYVDYLRVTFDDKYVEEVGPRSLDRDRLVPANFWRAPGGGRRLSFGHRGHPTDCLCPRHGNVGFRAEDLERLLADRQR